MCARVLLAEDDTSFRGLVARRLDRHGYDVYEAGSGDEAMRMLLLGWPSDEFELVILDHHMPGSTGLDVLSRLREERDATPALIMTAFPDPELIEHARRFGAAVLVKPFSRDGLVCIGQGPAPGEEPCEDTCEGAICISATDGIVALEGNDAPQMFDYIQVKKRPERK